MKRMIGILMLLGLMVVVGCGDEKESVADKPSERSPEYVIVSLNLRIKQPRYEDFAESSKLESSWFPLKSIIEMIPSFDYDSNPDLVMLLGIEGSTDVYTDGRVHQDALNQKIISAIKIPHKYHSRNAVLDMWDDDSKDTETAQFIGAAVNASALASGLPIAIGPEKITQIFQNQDDRISQVEFVLGDPAAFEVPIINSQYLSYSDLKVIYDVLQIAIPYEEWLDHLISAKVLVKYDKGFAFLIGELSVKFFEE